MMAKLLVLSIAFSGNLIWAGDSRDPRVQAILSRAKDDASWRALRGALVDVDFLDFVNCNRWGEFIPGAESKLRDGERQLFAECERSLAAMTQKDKIKAELEREASVKIEELMAACEVVLQESNKLLVEANQNGSWTLDALEVYQNQQAHLKQLRSRLVTEQARAAGDKK